MEDATICPGCGARLPRSDWSPPEGLRASGACWQVFAEVTGFELSHLALARDFHQLTVDTYGAQHADEETPPIRVVFSLLGLHLALDRGWSGVAVRSAHQRLAQRRRPWPSFASPGTAGDVTAADVAAAGARAGSVDGHAGSMRAWAASVWQAWEHEHRRVAELALRLLR